MRSSSQRPCPDSPRPIPQHARRRIGRHDPQAASVDRLLEPAVPARREVDLVEQEDPRQLGIQSHGLSLGHLAGRDLAGQPVVGEVEVGELSRGPARRKQVVGDLGEQDGLSDLPRPEEDDPPAVVGALDPFQHNGLQIAADWETHSPASERSATRGSGPEGCPRRSPECPHSSILETFRCTPQALRSPQRLTPPCSTPRTASASGSSARGSRSPSGSWTCCGGKCAATPTCRAGRHGSRWWRTTARSWRPAQPGSVTWVGHATFAIHDDDDVVLTDPHFGPRALLPPRLDPPGHPARGGAAGRVRGDLAQPLRPPRRVDGRPAAAERRLVRAARARATGSARAGRDTSVELDWWQSASAGAGRSPACPRSTGRAASSTDEARSGARG